jgi:MFS family permease
LTVFVGAFIMCGAVVLQTAATSVNMFIGARFVIGFGLTFASNAAPVLITEVAYPPYRVSMTALYNALWYSGAIMCVLSRLEIVAC